MSAAVERLATGADVAALLAELDRQPELWQLETARQTCPGSPHHATQAIYLRWCREMAVEAVFNDLVAVTWPAAAQLPAATALVLELMAELNCWDLGRVILARLPAGCAIDPHQDEGRYAEVHARFHLALQADPGNDFTVAGETVHMQPGEWWQFDRRLSHHVVNRSSRDRLHLIVDLLEAP